MGIRLLLGSTIGLCCWLSSIAQAGDFQLKDMQGHEQHLSAYQGKWVLVNFWATWCSPCLNEIPALNRLLDTHQNLAVIGIVMQSGSAAKIKEFAAAHQMRYPIVMGTRAVAAQVRASTGSDSELEVLPTSLLFGPKGELVYEQVGEITELAVAKLLTAKGTSLPR